MNVLIKIQSELKAPKGQINKFGNYKYRSAEDILEAVKPLCIKYGALLTLSDEMISVGSWIFVKATVTFKHENFIHTATAFARHPENKKGMDDSQITGAASSYARKYALNGLFCIDDTKDADATNTHEKTENSTFTELKTKIEAAKTIDQIKDIWNKNEKLHDDKEFIKLVITAKKQLTKTELQPL